MGDKRYKIVITETATEERLTSRDWVRGGTDGREKSGNDEWGYTPQISEMKRVKREVFKQDTDEIDLVAVIKAVNNIQ